MTVKDMPGGGKIIAWEPGDEIDWTTPDSEWHGHIFCGNCGWDSPCDCPRNCKACEEKQAYCGHLDPEPEDDPDDEEDFDEWREYEL
jgi:hypothetical protein